MLEMLEKHATEKHANVSADQPASFLCQVHT